MRQFSSDKLQIENASSGGPMFALGAGIRLVVLVLGVRAKYNALSAFNMWQLNGEVGFKIPIDKVDILFGVHGGYSFVGSLGDGTVAAGNSATPTNTDAVKIRGFNAGLDLALDYYVSPTFSVGAGVFVDCLFLNRPPVDKPAGLTPEQSALLDQDPLYQQSGTSAGLQARRRAPSRPALRFVTSAAEQLAIELGAPLGWPADRDGTKLVPMLCGRDETGERVLGDEGWLFELKLDGVRIVADKRGDARVARLSQAPRCHRELPRDRRGRREARRGARRARRRGGRLRREGKA